MTILGVDVGTTGLKMGVFRVEQGSLEMVQGFSKSYQIHTYNDGLFSDIDPEIWKEAFVAGCRHLGDFLGHVEVVALSGTTPGMTSMDRDGHALYPAILMLDQRSRQEAQHIINTVGMDMLMDATGNMPVAGGCSLASILWIKNNHADLFEKTHSFGHSNTFMARWMTGKFAMDPSSASLTALYNTSQNDLTWNRDIAQAFGLSIERLPQVIHTHESPGRVKGPLAKDLGLKKEPHVVIGGNDAVLAAYSVGIQDPGDIINVNGTCEITLVCLPKCLASKNYNVRAHVMPGRWLTLYVMNAGGTALEWFRNLFCSEMGTDPFYEDFIPRAIDAWVERESGVTYVPYLLGSRYSLEPLKAEFLGLTPETSREELLGALIKGLCQYQREHLDEIGRQVSLKEEIHITGGAVNPAIIRAKKKWMKDCDYIHEEESSMKGAALLGLKYLEQTQGITPYDTRI
jgi:sugar (pentulose or hexulose) kinase